MRPGMGDLSQHGYGTPMLVTDVPLYMQQPSARELCTNPAPWTRELCTNPVSGGHSGDPRPRNAPSNCLRVPWATSHLSGGHSGDPRGREGGNSYDGQPSVVVPKPRWKTTWNIRLFPRLLAHCHSRPFSCRRTHHTMPSQGIVRFAKPHHQQNHCWNLL